VLLAKDHDMVKAFPPERANQPFRMAVLPGGARGNGPVTNAHGERYIRASRPSRRPPKLLCLGDSAKHGSRAAWRMAQGWKALFEIQVFEVSIGAQY
jgi:hypothetical protein